MRRFELLRRFWPEAASNREGGDLGSGPAIVKTTATTTPAHCSPAYAQPPRARCAYTTTAVSSAVAVALVAAAVALVAFPQNPANTARVSEIRVENLEPAPSMARVYAGPHPTNHLSPPALTSCRCEREHAAVLLGLRLGQHLLGRPGELRGCPQDRYPHPPVPAPRALADAQIQDAANTPRSSRASTSSTTRSASSRF